MDIGISIPMRLYDGEELAAFAKAAEESSFASVTTGEHFQMVQQAWDEAGKPGKPYRLASTFFCLGPKAWEVYEAGMKEFYGYTEEMEAWAMAPDALTTPSAIRDAVKRFEDAGFDEMLLATARHQGPESVARLADAIG